MQQNTFRSVTAMVPAGKSLAAALEFYTRHMGFEIVWQTANMAAIRRGIGFLLVENDERNWAENASFSIGVDDLEALYAEYRNLPAQVGPLEMKFWGRREFHIVVPSGVCLQFYQHEAA